MLITKHRSALLRFLLILSLVVIILQPLSVYAHSGDTDSSGGHYDHEYGGYHYHCGGHSAHSHPGGICPYDGPVNKPSGGSGTGIGSSTGSNSSSSSTEDKYKNSDDDSLIFVYLIVAGIVIFMLYKLYREYHPSQPPLASTTSETEIFDPFPEIEPEPNTKPSTTLQRTPPSTSDSAVFTIPPKNPPKKETPMLQTTIYPSSKPPQTHTYNSGSSDELVKLRNGNDFLRKKVDKLNQQVISTNKENERLKRELSALKTELEQEKQRTNLQIPSLQATNTIPDYLKLPDENAYYEALRTSRTQKASSGKLILKQLFGKMYSEYSKKTYTTTLDSCTCDDFHYRKKVCKHMLAFALEIKAIDLKK